MQEREVNAQSRFLVLSIARVILYEGSRYWGKRMYIYTYRWVEGFYLGP